MIEEITQKKIKRLFVYSKKTGQFISRCYRGNLKPGDVAGCKSNGYTTLCIDSVQHSAHRLAYLYVCGRMPNGVVDHRDRNRGNNSWDNLRVVSCAKNMQNQNLRAANKTGYNGVGVCKNRFVASATIQSVSVNLGSHLTALDAALARFTWEVNCEEWECDLCGVLVTKIIEDWPEFNLRSVA